MLPSSADISSTDREIWPIPSTVELLHTHLISIMPRIIGCIQAMTILYILSPFRARMAVQSITILITTTIPFLRIHLFFNSMNQQQSYTYNYLFCEVRFNDKFKYDYSVNHDAVAAHEIGHVLGLAHSNGNPYSIMCQAYNRLVDRPQKVDNDEIVSIYGAY